MTARRWTLILLVTLAVAAGLIYALSGPVDNPRVAGTEPALAALPLQLPTPEPVRPDAASVAPSSPLPARNAVTVPSAPRIGSEGYGPHIERAQAGGDAQAAWEAVQWLHSCASNDNRRDSAEQARSKGIAPDMMTQLMVEADDEARRCQTVTAQHRALLPELAARAMRASIPPAAFAYANSVEPAKLTTAERQEVADAMRSAARTGAGLIQAFESNKAWGLSTTECLSYFMAATQLSGAPMSKSLEQAIKRNGFFSRPAPTPDEWIAAEQEARQIVEGMRATPPR